MGKARTHLVVAQRRAGHLLEHVEELVLADDRRALLQLLGERAREVHGHGVGPAGVAAPAGRGVFFEQGRLHGLGARQVV